jgi:hypothetical protein
MKTLETIKNFAICNTWIIYMAVLSAFIFKGSIFSVGYWFLVGGTFALNLYKDKVRDKLKKLEAEIESNI